ncbi:MAG: hypothetical protein K8R52_07320, partial [Bacteroidales bacterium]|nr:hypothetical protein [Bacteroidales bacterium]
ESMETAQKNFRRLIRYLKGRDDIELTTYRELVERFAYQVDKISKEELRKIAKRVLDENRVVIEELYSPAEIFSAFSGALIHFEAEGELPAEIAIRRPFGPLEMPAKEPEFDQISVKGILDLSGKAEEYIENRGHLPALLSYEGQMIGTGSLLALFSELYLKVEDPKLPDQLSVIPFEPYPTINEESIINGVAGCKGWPVHREELDMSHLIEMTKLQLWTLKPALENSARN